MKNANNNICNLFDYDEYPQPSKKKREYIKGGRGGKIKGFNFYLKNERLTKKQRQTLISQCQNYERPIEINPCNCCPEELFYGFELDPSWNDIELMGIWNEMYDSCGNYFPQFKDQWEREQTRGFNKHFKENKCRDKDKSNIKDENTSKIQEFLKSKRKSHQQNDDNYVDLG